MPRLRPGILGALAADLLLVGLLLVGCAARTVTPGEPAHPSPTAAVPQLPPRPQELRMDGVDPCTLLTPQQQQQLGIDTPPRAGGGSGRGEPACSYDHTSPKPFYSLNVVTVPFEGASAWLQRSRSARIIEVAGFGAAEVRSGGSGPADICIVTADVADGQNLGVLFTGDGAGSFTADEMCELARGAAAAAIETLLAR